MKTLTAITLTNVVLPEYWSPTSVNSISSFQNRDLTQSKNRLISANISTTDKFYHFSFVFLSARVMSSNRSVMFGRNYALVIWPWCDYLDCCSLQATNPSGTNTNILRCKIVPLSSFWDTEQKYKNKSAMNQNQNVYCHCMLTYKEICCFS